MANRACAMCGVRALTCMAALDAPIHAASIDEHSTRGTVDEGSDKKRRRGGRAAGAQGRQRAGRSARRRGGRDVRSGGGRAVQQIADC